jgi:CBS domain-containing protein
MKVGKLCGRRPVSVPGNAPLSEVVRLMHQERVGAVIVTYAPADQPVVVGIVTDRDIVHAQLAHVADFSQLNTADTMSRDPLVLNEQDDIAEALRRLRARGVRRAPVVTGSGALLGLVSTDDLLAQIARDLSGLAGIVARQSPRVRA